jgi:glycosyltransferase involved in cell wall biosynthesis
MDNDNNAGRLKVALMDNDNNAGRLKVALMVNIVAPSRVALYSALAEHFDLLVLHGGTENNRESWDDLGKKIPNADVRRAWGFQIRKMQKANGKAFNPRLIHITPGFGWSLVRFRPDAVISNEMGFRTLIALLYGTLARRPVWVWWGGTRHTERKIGMTRRAVRFFISRWARNWISYGQTSTEYLISLGIHRNRILEAQNCVDERSFSEAVEPAFQLEPRPVLLHAGQFIGRKGIDLLLKAAAVIQQEGHEFSLLLVGSGRDKQELEALAKDLQLKNVRFEPGRDPFKMAAVYRSADVLIFPTLEDVWGLAANEAILCALPVLCSKYAGCAEELFSPDSIFDPNNPEEFVANLRKATAGRVPRSDPSRLKTTAEVVDVLVRAIDPVRRPIGSLAAAQSEPSK